MSRNTHIVLIAVALLLGTAVLYLGCDNPFALRVAREHGAVRPGTNRPVNFRIVGDQAAADAAIPCLPYLDSITSIEISRVDLTDEQLEAIGKKTKIVRLTLQDCGIDDEDLAFLSGLEHVSSLRLDKNPITDAGLHYLANMKRLHLLSLQATGITGPGLSTIKHFPELTELNLNATPIDDDGLEHLIQSNSRIRTLWLRSTNITPEGYLRLAELIWLTGPFYSDDFVGPEDDPNERLKARRDLQNRFRHAQQHAINEAEERGEPTPRPGAAD